MRAFDARVAAYLLKGMAAQELVNALRYVDCKGGYLHPKVTLSFIESYRYLKTMEVQMSELEDLKTPTQVLTSREYEILQLIAAGCSNRLLSDNLSISEKTVKNHVSAILRKMSVVDRTVAVVELIRRGWIVI